ncbi:MAG: TetR/AcrR family transcriptional regulator [Microthrixaceae bacterium]
MSSTGLDRGDDEPTLVRERIMEATVRCVEDSGVRGFSLEQVAARAEVSRTTIYNQFPGGRSQLVEATATWEIARFWGRLAEAVQDLPTLEDRLVLGLVLGRKVMSRSRIVSNLMDPDVAELIAAVRPSEPIIHGVIRDYMRDALEAEAMAGRLRPGVDPEDAADYLMRMTLSWLGSPAGVDLTDEVATRKVVRSQFLAGILAS